MGLITRAGARSLTRTGTRHRWRAGMPRRYRRVIGAVMAALALALMLAAGTAGRAQAATLLSQGMPTTASSTESAAYPASAAVDGDTTTRWSSACPVTLWARRSSPLDHAHRRSPR
jgi:hypothetical protein